MVITLSMLIILYWYLNECNQSRIAGRGENVISGSSLLRELLIRTVVTANLAAVAYFFLHAGIWVLTLPVGIGIIVVIKWVLRPRLGEEEEPTTRT